MKYDLASLMKKALDENNIIVKYASLNGVVPERLSAEGFQEIFGEPLIDHLNRLANAAGIGERTLYAVRLMIQNLETSVPAITDPFVETWGKNGKVSVTSVIEKLKEFSEDIETSVEFGMDDADRFGFGGNKEEIARDAAEELGVDYRYIEHFDDNKWYSESKDEEEKKECIHEDLLKEMSKYQDN